MDRQELMSSGFWLFPRAAHDILRQNPEKELVFQAIVHAAAFKPRSVGGVNIPVGGVAMSIARLREETLHVKNRQMKHIPETTLRRILSELESEGWITRTNTKIGALITVLNFDLFNDVRGYKRNLAPPNLAPLDDTATPSGATTYGDTDTELGRTCAGLGGTVAAEDLAGRQGVVNAEITTDYDNKNTELGGELGGPAKLELGGHLTPSTLPSEFHSDVQTDRPARPEGDAGSSDVSPSKKIFLHLLEDSDFDGIIGMPELEPYLYELKMIPKLYGEMYQAVFGVNHPPIDRNSFHNSLMQLYVSIKSDANLGFSWQENILQFLENREWGEGTTPDGRKRDYKFQVWVGARMISVNAYHAGEGRYGRYD